MPEMVGQRLLEICPTWLNDRRTTDSQSALFHSREQIESPSEGVGSHICPVKVEESGHRPQAARETNENVTMNELYNYIYSNYLYQ